MAVHIVNDDSNPLGTHCGQDVLFKNETDDDAYLDTGEPVISEGEAIYCLMAIEGEVCQQCLDLMNERAGN